MSASGLAAGSAARAARGVSSPVYWLAVTLFCLAWSSAFPAAKLAIVTAPPLLFLGVRFLAAAAILMAVAVARGQASRLPWARLMLLGILNQALYQGPSWLGMRTTSAGLATIIASLNPILIAVLAAPLLGERLGWRKLAGLALGFAGAAFVVRNRVISVGDDPAGVAWLVVGLLAITFGTLLYKKFAPGIALVPAVALQQAGAGSALLVAGLASERIGDVAPDAQFWLAMAWFVLVVSIGALLLWFWLLSVGTASAASSLHFLMPPLGLLMSWAALGEPLEPLDLVGAAPVALGIWLATRPARVPRAPV